jgi:hypothetical protein
MEPWGSLRVALGAHWGGFGFPIGWLSTGFGGALGALWGGFGRSVIADSQGPIADRLALKVRCRIHTALFRRDSQFLPQRLSMALGRPYCMSSSSSSSSSCSNFDYDYEDDEEDENRFGLLRRTWPPVLAPEQLQDAR